MMERMKVASGSSNGCEDRSVEDQIDKQQTHRVFLLACQLSRSLKIDAEERKVSFLALADVLDRIDIERYSIPMDREDDRVRFLVDEDL